VSGGIVAVSRPTLLDNTILTNFALIDRAELVMQLWPTAACTTAAVVTEYAVGVAEGLLPADAWTDLPVVGLTGEEAAFAESLSSKVARGSGHAWPPLFTARVSWPAMTWMPAASPTNTEFPKRGLSASWSRVCGAVFFPAKRQNSCWER
jgi:hypothetical protein